MPPTDATLLLSFARHRDEAAFRQLAERHFGLIFHTALRRTRDRMLAEEVSQNILCTVARKAPALLLRADRFPAWLHRATLFEASKVMRTEAARLRHARLQHPDEIPATGTASTTGAWELALPHLDDSLNALPESDRNVLVLHFFENLPFPKIASLMGKKPAAVQKQSIRALDKLSRLLRAHTTALPSGAIITGLLAESAKAAPFSLLPALTTTALASAPGLSITAKLVLMLTTHSKSAMAAVILLLAIPLGLQEVAIARAERELAGFDSHALVLSPRKHPPARTAAALSARLDLFALADEAATAQQVEPAKMALDRKLAALSTDDLVALLDRLRSTTDLGEAKHQLLLELLGRKLLDRDVALGMQIATANGWLKDAWVKQPYQHWLESDLPAARSWLLATQALPAYAPPSKPVEFDSVTREQHLALLNRLDSSPLLDFQSLLASRLMKDDSSAARSYLQTFPVEEARLDIVVNIFRGSLGPKNWQMTTAETAGWLDVIREDLPPESSASLLKEFARMVMWRGNGGPSLENFTLVSSAGVTPGERRAIALSAATETLTHNEYPIDPNLRQKTDDWLDRFIPEEAAGIGNAAQASADAWMDRRATLVLEEYARQRELPSDDQILSSFSSVNFRNHLPEALAVAAKVRDPRKRSQLEQDLKQRAAH